MRALLLCLTLTAPTFAQGRAAPDTTQLRVATAIATTGVAAA